MNFPKACLIHDELGTKGGKFVRLYGVALGLTRCKRVRVLLADGRIVYRQPENIAVYETWPANWSELFQKGQVAFRKKPFMD